MTNISGLSFTMFIITKDGKHRSKGRVWRLGAKPHQALPCPRPLENRLQRWYDSSMHYRYTIATTITVQNKRMTKFVITETLWSTVIVKTVIVSLHSGRFVVVHLYSSFPITPKIFPEGQIFTKNLAIFGTVRPHFKATLVKFGVEVKFWDALPRQNFVQIK